MQRSAGLPLNPAAVAVQKQKCKDPQEFRKIWHRRRRLRINITQTKT